MLVAILVNVSLAGSAEVDRESYRAAVEPLCKRNTQANERIFAGVRSEVREGKVKLAAVRFEKAAGLLGRTIESLAAVPRPRTDMARLKSWFSHLKLQSRLFGQIATKLDADEKLKAQRLFIELTSNAARANAKVIPFEFEYCRLEPARFM